MSLRIRRRRAQCAWRALGLTGALFVSGCGDDPVVGDWYLVESTNDFQQFFIIEAEQNGVYRIEAFRLGAHIATREFPLTWSPKDAEHSYSVAIALPNAQRTFTCTIGGTQLKVMTCADSTAEFLLGRIDDD